MKPIYIVKYLIYQAADIHAINASALQHQDFNWDWLRPLALTVFVFYDVLCFICSL